MARIKEEKPRGILNAKAAEGLRRYHASDDLAAFVEHFWIVTWDFDQPRTAETIPHPSVHMVLDREHPEVVGVMHAKFSRTLQGKGRVVSTKFRPGGFRPFVDRPVAAFSDRRWPLDEVFGRRAAGLASRVFASGDDATAIECLESFLRSFHPVPDEAMSVAGRIVARIAEERAITRVDQIVEEFSIPARQLQRLFREYVGVSPKWVIQRYRLIEAAERIAAGTITNWPALAHDLGYSDQAHFIRDYKRLIGMPPARNKASRQLPNRS